MTVTVSSTGNPYRQGSLKHILMKWALEKNEFTKEDFLKAVIELKNEHERISKMSDEVLAKAWWNEFYNKHEVFIDKQ
jgi:hypothetical protein